MQNCAKIIPERKNDSESPQKILPERIDLVKSEEDNY